MITEFHSGTFPFYASYENHRLHSPLQEKKPDYFRLCRRITTFAHIISNNKKNMAESNFVDYVKSIAVPVRAAEAPRTCGVKIHTQWRPRRW